MNEDQLEEITGNNAYIRHYLANKKVGDQRILNSFNTTPDKKAIKNTKILTMDALHTITGLLPSEVMPSEFCSRFDASFRDLLQLQHIDPCLGTYTKHKTLFDDVQKMYDVHYFIYCYFHILNT